MAELKNGNSVGKYYLALHKSKLVESILKRVLFQATFSFCNLKHHLVKYLPFCFFKVTLRRLKFIINYYLTFI